MPRARREGVSVLTKQAASPYIAIYRLPRDADAAAATEEESLWLNG